MNRKRFLVILLLALTETLIGAEATEPRPSVYFISNTDAEVTLTTRQVRDQSLAGGDLSLKLNLDQAHTFSLAKLAPKVIDDPTWLKNIVAISAKVTDATGTKEKGKTYKDPWSIVSDRVYLINYQSVVKSYSPTTGTIALERELSIAHTNHY